MLAQERADAQLAKLEKELETLKTPEDIFRKKLREWSPDKEEEPNYFDPDHSLLYQALMTPVPEPLSTREDILQHATCKPYQEVLSRPGKEELTALSANFYVQACHGHVPYAEASFEYLKEHYSVSPRDYSILLFAHDNSEGKDLRRMRDILTEYNEVVEDKTAIPYTIFIRSLLRHDKLKEAYDVLNELKTLGVEADQVLYSVLLFGCFLHRQFDKAWGTFDYMRQNVADPDQITYTIMLAICAETHQAERAWNLFREMQRMGQRPLHKTFDYLIASCAGRPDFYREAFSAFALMKAGGYEPSYHTYICLLKAIARAGDIERADNLQAAMNEKRMELTAPAYLQFIRCRAYAQRHQTEFHNKNIQAAEKYFNEFVERGFTVNNTILNALLAVHTEAFRVKRSLEIFTWYERYGLKPDERSYGTLIKMYSRCRRVDQMLELVEQMQKERLDFNAYILKYIVWACARAGYINSAMKFLRMLPKRPASEQTPPNFLGLLRQRCLPWPDLVKEIDETKEALRKTRLERAMKYRHYAVKPAEQRMMGMSDTQLKLKELSLGVNTEVMKLRQEVATLKTSSTLDFMDPKHLQEYASGVTKAKPKKRTPSSN